MPNRSKTFSSKSEAELWLSQFYLTSIVGDSLIDAKHYAEVGVIWGDDGGPIRAALLKTKDIPVTDVKTGKAKLFGARGLPANSNITLISTVLKHLPGRHSQKHHASKQLVVTLTQKEEELAADAWKKHEADADLTLEDVRSEVKNASILCDRLGLDVGTVKIKLDRKHAASACLKLLDDRKFPEGFVREHLQAMLDSYDLRTIGSADGLLVSAEVLNEVYNSIPSPNLRLPAEIENRLTAQSAISLYLGIASNASFYPGMSINDAQEVAAENRRFRDNFPKVIAKLDALVASYNAAGFSTTWSPGDMIDTVIYTSADKPAKGYIYADIREDDAFTARVYISSSGDEGRLSIDAESDNYTPSELSELLAVLDTDTGLKNLRVGVGGKPLPPALLAAYGFSLRLDLENLLPGYLKGLRNVLLSTNEPGSRGIITKMNDRRTQKELGAELLRSLSDYDSPKTDWDKPYVGEDEEGNIVIRGHIDMPVDKALDIVDTVVLPGVPVMFMGYTHAPYTSRKYEFYLSK